ncbi:MAG TPA: pyruvate dehydrogenase complex dihydrolipoamide acetyltransferase [Microscillaceae bacterium]|nr:pyruvate dehydrogenase complex dihydrolipoamide acetyltransferase [Microscillaceae bacterium]
MAQIIYMPKMSDTMEEGVIAQWLKKVGDTIAEGDIIAEVETDKATMELESYEEGTLLYVAVEDGGTVPVDGLLAIVGQPGEDYKPLLAGGATTTAEPTPVADAAPATSAPAATQVVVDNAKVVTMPKMSDTMEEGVIAQWLKKVGDKVAEGDILAEVETDKATMEMEAYDDGILLYIAVEDGGSVPVDGLLAVIGEAGANFQALVDQFNAGGATTTVAPAPAPVAEATPAPSSNGSSTAVATPATPAPVVNNTNGRVKISPLARKLAAEKGYDIAQITGTGDHGRIVKRDIENFVPAPATKPATTQESSSVAVPMPVGTESYKDVKVSQMRKTIARRLSESKFTAPHFYVTMEIRMDKIMDARKHINAVSPVKVSFNDLVIKAVAMSIRRHQNINASWMKDTIRYNDHIHIGMAVAVPDGLFVPVVRFADTLSISQVAATTKDLVAKTKDKKLQPSDWEGSTFSVSNLGMFGVEDFTAIINPPDACILAVGGIKQTAVVGEDGQLEVGNVMKVTLSSDHRVVDGALAAAFLKTLKQMLENPYMMLV